MLDRQRQRVDVPVHARTAHDGLLGLLQKSLEEDLCRIIPPMTQSVMELNSGHYQRNSSCTVFLLQPQFQPLSTEN